MFLPHRAVNRVPVRGLGSSRREGGLWVLWGVTERWQRGDNRNKGRESAKPLAPHVNRGNAFVPTRELGGLHRGEKRLRVGSIKGAKRILV
jgi:hypothetical protein